MLLSQLLGVVPPLLSPPYIMHVGFSPPLFVTLPCSVACVCVILVAPLSLVIVGGLIGVVTVTVNPFDQLLVAPFESRACALTMYVPGFVHE